MSDRIPISKLSETRAETYRDVTAGTVPGTENEEGWPGNGGGVLSFELKTAISGRVWAGDAARSAYFSGLTSLSRVTQDGNGDWNQVEALIPDLSLLDAPNTTANSGISAVHVTPSGAYLVHVKKNNSGGDVEFCYRCADPDGSPTTWTGPVFLPGYGASTHYADIGRTLGPMNYANIRLGDGSDAIVFGEYSNGVADTLLQVWISPDDGVNWYVLWQLNTEGGTENFRHIHGVGWNPVLDKIMVFTGDPDPQAAVIQGDPPVNAAACASRSHNWAAIDGANQVTIDANANFHILYNSQAFRVFGLVWLNGKGYGHPDAAADYSTTGIWEFEPDLSDYRRVHFPKWMDPNRGSPPWAKIMGGGFLQLSNGHMLFSDYLEQDRSGVDDDVERNTWFHVSANGKDWHTVAYARMDQTLASGTSAVELFEVAGDIFLGGNYAKRLYPDGSGQQQPVVTLGGLFSGEPRKLPLTGA